MAQQHQAGSVDAYWSEHTVQTREFATVQESLDFLEWRFAQYPLFREFMALHAPHAGGVILDYGCGLGNDVAGFLHFSNPAKVIGVDISPKALALTEKRLRLHQADPARYALVQTRDAATSVPLPDASVDYLQCLGVLQHASHPESLLKDFFRVLKPGREARVMVYNRESVWLHLYVAYVKIILQNAFPGMDLDTAFSKTTDGAGCPVSRCWDEAAFTRFCTEAGFAVKYLGGYLSLHELDMLRRYGDQAVSDERLAREHRDFLASMTRDAAGLPMQGKFHCGIGAVFHLRKP